MRATPLLSSLSPARRQLVRLCQDLNFGRIEQLPVAGGEPVLAPFPRTVSEVKFAAQNGMRTERGLADFLLKRQHIDLMRLLSSVGDGHIARIVVKHGLPFSAEAAG